MYPFAWACVVHCRLQYDGAASIPVATRVGCSFCAKRSRSWLYFLLGLCLRRRSHSEPYGYGGPNPTRLSCRASQTRLSRCCLWWRRAHHCQCAQPYQHHMPALGVQHDGKDNLTDCAMSSFGFTPQSHLDMEALRMFGRLLKGETPSGLFVVRQLHLCVSLTSLALLYAQRAT